MNKLFLFIVSGFFILFIGCNVDSTYKNVDIELEKEKVALVLEKYVIANEKQDIDLVHEIWAAEPDIVVFGTNSDEKIIGWEQIRSTLQRQYDSFEDTYISVRDQVIHVNETGNTAWFSEIMNYNYIYQGEARQFEGLRFTGVLEKKDGEWFIVQSHISIPGSPD
jgi:ketosteroid isomerase-like protein